MRHSTGHFWRLPLILALILMIGLLVPNGTSQAEIEEGEWLAEYYGNPLLFGDVLAEETLPGPGLQRSWAPEVTPIEGVPVNEFSVRFTTLETFEDSNYNFRLMADDGARLYINGALIIDAWEEGEQAQDFFASRVLPIEDGTYTVTVEFYELYGLRDVEVFWEETDAEPAAGDEDFTVPGSVDDDPDPDPDDDDDDRDNDTGGGSDGPGDPTAPYDAWRVRYFPNTTLTGPAVASETIPATDSKIAISWDPGLPPIEDVPANEFSARFQQNIRVEEDTNYKFILTADDGARLLINGTEVINAFDPGEQAQTYFKSRVIPVPEGTYTLTIEYFESFGIRQMEMQATPTSDLPAAGDEDFVISGDAPTSDVEDDDDGTDDDDDGPPDTPGAVGFTIDQWDPEFIWSGSQAWNTVRDDSAIEGVFITTDNSERTFRMYGRWNTFIHAEGDYEVYVYIPDYPDATESARYRVFHSGRLSDPIVINQSVADNQWVLLGTFNFDAGGSQFVYLNDMTEEDAGTTNVLFDAVRLEPAD